MSRRVEILEAREARFHDERLRLQRSVESERGRRRAAEDAVAAAKREVEQAVARERHAKARARALAVGGTGAAGGGQGGVSMMMTDAKGALAAKHAEEAVREAGEQLERAHRELHTTTARLRQEQMSRQQAEHSLRLAESLLSGKTAEALRLRAAQSRVVAAAERLARDERAKVLSRKRSMHCDVTCAYEHTLYTYITHTAALGRKRSPDSYITQTFTYIYLQY